MRTDTPRRCPSDWRHLVTSRRVCSGRVQMSRPLRGLQTLKESLYQCVFSAGGGVRTLLLARSLCTVSQLENCSFTTSCFIRFSLATKYFVLINTYHWSSQWQNGSIETTRVFNVPLFMVLTSLATLRCVLCQSLSLPVFSQVTTPWARQNFSWNLTRESFTKICQHVPICIQIRHFCSYSLNIVRYIYVEAKYVSTEICVWNIFYDQCTDPADLSFLR